jgi:FkbH-like protein
VFPRHRVNIATGVFGDLSGNLERLSTMSGGTAVAIIEWADLDPRLGIRILGGWAPAQLNDFVQTARFRAERIRAALGVLAPKNKVVAVPPTLPIPPIAYTPTEYGSKLESALHVVKAELRNELSELSGVAVLSTQTLDMLSPLHARLNAKSELNTGFPYSTGYADTLADLISRLVGPPHPKKGIITDLDNTLWSGILGEVGVDGISWDLDNHTLRHGLYQQLLASLAESGILVGVASKNDPRLVEEAFRERKPALARDRIFPLEANWGPKSESVRKIVETWNIGYDSVVFLDDSPLELAEVQAAHPEIECVLFPHNDDKGVYELLWKLRDTFGKTTVTAEDAIRLDSIRASAAVAEAGKGEGYTPEKFMQEAGGRLTVSFVKDPPDSRALELINKTNQFNLNGKRHTDGTWRQYLSAPGVFLAVASYEDKYGLLGKIAVVAGRIDGKDLALDHWVMSCRAFSRRIEHGCLLRIFQKFDVDRVTFDFVKTPRNQPIQSFLNELAGDATPPTISITKKQLLDSCPPVYFKIQEL